MKAIIRLLEYWRYQAFWAIDFIKGSKVKKHLKEIEFILEPQDDNQAQTILKDHFERVLHHAATTVPFYKRLKPGKGLDSFPVIDKNTINKNPALFKSEVWEPANNKMVTTSGSTGAFLTIARGQNKNYRNTADNLYFQKRPDFN